MIVFIDDEKWLIECYIDELDNKSKSEPKYSPIHFYYPKDALIFIKENSVSIDLIIMDMAMDYGDGNLLSEDPGGIQFYKNIKMDPTLMNIPIIIMTVHGEHYVSSLLKTQNINDSLTIYIYRGQSDMSFFLWKSIDQAIKQKHF
jgi:CheY-like chemotaxis protein